MRINTIKLQERTSGRKGSGDKVFQMCVPRCIAKSLGWKKGDTLTIKKGQKWMKVKKKEEFR